MAEENERVNHTKPERLYKHLLKRSVIAHSPEKTHFKTNFEGLDACPYTHTLGLHTKHEQNPPAA